MQQNDANCVTLAITKAILCSYLFLKIQSSYYEINKMY